MADLPTYEQSMGDKPLGSAAENEHQRTPHRYSIRDEVSVSRSQHVAVLVSKVLPSIKQRARQGIARSTFLLIPSDQVDVSTKGQLVGFPVDDLPVMVQLEGRFDTTQFWAQREALDLLRDQMLEAVSGELPTPVVDEPLPDPPPQALPKSSFFGRRSAKKSIPEPVKVQPPKPPVTIHVFLDHISFRSETEYGLFETLRARAVLVAVDVT